MKHLGGLDLTDEDRNIWIHRVMIRFLPGTGLATHSMQSDTRDFELLLDNVKHHVSAVVQAPTGDWCYFVHGSVATGTWVRHL